MGQYFDNDPNIKSNQKIISFVIANKQFDFISDNGVFSKGKIDQGSIVLLKTLIKNATIKGDILDLGAGYGTIGLTLASLYREAKFLLVDINTRACTLARKNMTRMGLDNVKIKESDRFSSINERKFDIVITNPPIRAGKNVIYSMFKEAYEHLAPNGRLYIVIRKDQGANTASKYIESVYGNCTLIDRDKGYHIYEAKKEESVKANTEIKEELQ